MARIGVTGHVALSDDTAIRVYDLIRDALREVDSAELRGVTCLAKGSDQLFARAVMARGGTFEVILPARDYRERVIAGKDLVAFDELIEHAVRVSYMPFARSGRTAYRAASVEVLRRCDMLFAVWDGRASQRPGDTADVVRMAHRRALPVKVLWPDNGRRKAASRPVPAGRRSRAGRVSR